MSTIDFAFLLGRGEPISTTELVRACDTFEQIFGGAQELASEQRSSGSAARGGAYWPYADQGNPLQWRAILERMEERGLHRQERSSKTALAAITKVRDEGHLL